MADLTVNCPTCQTEIPLTETLAGPIIEAERRKFETQIRERAAAVESRERQVRDTEKKVAELRRQVDSQAADVEKAVQKRLGEERASIVASEAKKVRAQFQAQLEA